MARKDKKTRDLAFTAFVLSTPFILWALLMREHTVIHQYQVLLLIPAVAIAAGLMLDRLRLYTGSTVPPRQLQLVLVLFVAVMGMGLVRETYAAWTVAVESQSVEYGREIEALTPPGAVVLSTANSMVPVYYSRRHMIRGIRDDSILQEVLGPVQQAFPESPIYLAIPSQSIDDFSESVATLAVTHESYRLTLIRLQ